MISRTLGLIIVAILAAILLFIGYLMLTARAPEAPAPAATTTPVMEPTEEKPTTSNDAPPPLSARVVITSPERGVEVAQMFTVAGLAPGPWFFEASFPVQVRDKEGNVLGRAVAQAQGEWMTEKQVTFTATMQIDKAYHGPATLILMKDNPSGLPEHDDSVEVPIVIQ